MSSHSMKSKSRHPDKERETYQVGHITFEICEDKYGATFALIAGEAAEAKDRRPLFSGHISAGMYEELRALAYRIKQLEPAND